MKSRNMYEGPEFTLANEQRILWTSATGKNQAEKKRAMLGYLFYTNRIYLDKALVPEHTFYWVTQES